MAEETQPEPVLETNKDERENSKQPDQERPVENDEEKKSNLTHSSDEEEKRPKPAPLPKKPPELVQYWEAVKNHPEDFTGWTYLLQYVEQKNIIEFYREAFDEFFTHYPYCYGYWKKYGDAERKQGNPDRAQQVFERGVEAIPLCPDLWIHYISFQMQDLLQDEMRKEKLRELFERALKACGLDYRSDKLWDQYIKFEKQQSAYVRITAIYDRLLNTPTQHLQQNMTNFKELMRSRSPKETLSLDEFLKLRTEYVSSKKKDGDVGTEKESDETKEVASPPGDEHPPGEGGEPPTEKAPPESNGDAPPGGELVPPGEDMEELSDAAELDGVRELAIKVREEVFKRTEEELRKRKKFEDQIRRPYFHAKPLEKGQIKNWKNYLDFEIKEGSKERIRVLFERAVIACALYEEMWEKYATHMETAKHESVTDVYQRACTIHLPRKASLHLRWAAYEESRGNIDDARKVLSDLHQSIPGVVSVMLERVNLERRQKKYSRVITMLNEYMDGSKKADHLTFFASKLACFLHKHDALDRRHKKCSLDIVMLTEIMDGLRKADHLTFFAGEVARFLHKVVGDLDAAKEVLEKAVKKDGIKEVLFMKLVDLEYQRNPIDEDETYKVFQQILEKDLPLETKLIFSKRKLEFCRDFSINVKRFQAALDDHNKLLKEQHSILKKRKHQAEDESGDSKKAKTTTSTVPAGSTASQAAYTPQAPHPATNSTYPQPHQPHYTHQSYQQPPQQMDHGYNYQQQQQWPQQNYQNPYQYQQPQWNSSYGTGYYPS